MIITSEGNIPSQYAHSLNVMKMAQGFNDIGEDVTLITYLSLPLIKSRMTFGDVHNLYAVDKKVKIKYLSAFDRNFFINTVGGKKFNINTARYIKRNNPNFAYCRSYLTPYYCVKLGVPTIIETHTTNYENENLKKIYEIANNKNFLGMVTIHENIKAEHIKRGIPEEKILVADDGVDLKLFDIEDDRLFWRERLNLPRNKKIVLYCGSLYKEKGIKDIILTAKKLEIAKDIIFIIVGGHKKQIDEWKQYCLSKKITNIVFTGFVSVSFVPQYLKSADVLIMPYKINLDYSVMDINTTSPIKLFEYMASNRPIVSSNIPVIAKLIKNKESGLLASSNDIDELATLILELLNDGEKAKAISSNAFNLVKNYSWKSRCEKIKEYFI